MNVNKLLIGFLILLNLSCEIIGPNQFNLLSDFIITEDQPNVWKFNCKLGCGIFPDITNIESIKWNKNTIVLKQDGNKNDLVWYYFQSNSDSIKCCYPVKIVGPISFSKIEELISKDKNSYNSKRFK